MLDETRVTPGGPAPASGAATRGPLAALTGLFADSPLRPRRER